jgi:hypothetical protein
MTNKFIKVGAGAMVLIGIIVVIAFIQNQNDRAVAQQAYEIIHIKNLCNDMASGTGTEPYSYSFYYECVKDYSPGGAYYTTK